MTPTDRDNDHRHVHNRLAAYLKKQRRTKANKSNVVGAAGRTVTSHRRGSRILGHPGEETRPKKSPG